MRNVCPKCDGIGFTVRPDEFCHPTRNCGNGVPPSARPLMCQVYEFHCLEEHRTVCEACRGTGLVD